MDPSRRIARDLRACLRVALVNTVPPNPSSRYNLVTPFEHLIDRIHHADILRPIIMAANEPARLEQCSPCFNVRPAFSVVVIGVDENRIKLVPQPLTLTRGVDRVHPQAVD